MGKASIVKSHNKFDLNRILSNVKTIHSYSGTKQPVHKIAAHEEGAFSWKIKNTGVGPDVCVNSVCRARTVGCFEIAAREGDYVCTLCGSVQNHAPMTSSEAEHRYIGDDKEKDKKLRAGGNDFSSVPQALQLAALLTFETPQRVSTIEGLIRQLNESSEFLTRDELNTAIQLVSRFVAFEQSPDFSDKAIPKRSVLACAIMHVVSGSKFQMVAWLQALVNIGVETSKDVMSKIARVAIHVRCVYSSSSSTRQNGAYMNAVIQIGNHIKCSQLDVTKAKDILGVWMNRGLNASRPTTVAACTYYEVIGMKLDRPERSILATHLAEAVGLAGPATIVAVHSTMF